MGFYTKISDKKSGDGLALTEWNDLSNAVAGNSGLTLALNPADKVVIGKSTSPDSKLTVQGDVNIGGVGNGKLKSRHLIGKAHNSASIGDLYLNYNTGKNVHIGKGGNTSDLIVNGNANATKFIGDGSQLTNLSIGLKGLNLATKGGRVAIGHTIPVGTLDVARGTAPEGTAMFRGTNRISHFNFSSDEHTYIRGGKANSNVFINDNGGNVGIGTTDPQSKLHIVNKSTDANGDTLNLGPASGSNLRMGYHTNYSWIQSHGSKPLSINSLGNNVGIKTTDPKDTLDVNGVLRLSSSSNFCRIYPGGKSGKNWKGIVFELNKSTHGNNRKVMLDGDGNVDSWSDKRLKTNIANEKDILPRLMQLDVKNYNWKDDPDREFKSIGFIAQDVKSLFPSLVGEFEDSETKESTMTLKYTNFSVLAIGAIKEQKLEYDKRIAALENRLKRLEKN